MVEKIYYFWENKVEGGVVLFFFGVGLRMWSNKEFDLLLLMWGEWNLGFSGLVFLIFCYFYFLRLNNFIFGCCGSKEVLLKVEKIMCVCFNF